MGSIIEVNDTLQITKEQGFPVELNLERHLKNPLKTEDFGEKIFGFKNKSGNRVYQAPPVRNFLVENREGKWIYWGLVHVFDVTHNSDNTTSGRFKIIYLYTPEEMKIAHNLIDRSEKTRYFQT